MNVVNKFYIRGLYLILFLGLSMFSYGQIGSETPNVQDGDDDGSIFETDIKGSPPRADGDCYSLNSPDDAMLGMDFSFDLPGPLNLGNGRCDLTVRITIGGIQFDFPIESLLLNEAVVPNGVEQSLSGSLDFPMSIIQSLMACEEGVMIIPIKMEFVCLMDETESIMTVAEVNELFGITNTGTNGNGESIDGDMAFSEEFDLEFCCDYIGNFKPGFSIPNLPTTISGFNVISSNNNYELIFDEYYSNKDIRIDIYDMTGKVLLTKNVSFGNNAKVIQITKPMSQSSLHIISVRTSNEVKTKKVFNY